MLSMIFFENTKQEQFPEQNNTKKIQKIHPYGLFRFHSGFFRKHNYFKRKLKSG